jgi:DNA-binding MarR family transcriptional regulator
MPARPIDIAQALHRFGLQRDRFRSALSRQTGLALADLDALEHLEADGPITQRELGERLLLTSGAVTMLVDRLERGGWVRRTRHPTDRRSLLVGLTDKADREQPPGLARYHAAIAAAAREIPGEARAHALAFVERAASEASRAVDVRHDDA